MKDEHETQKVALVTGATSGLGQAIALRLAEEGWTVYGTGRRPGRSDSLEGGVRLLALDVCDQASVDQAVSKVLAESRRLDLLVACAGMGISGSVEESPMAEIEVQMDVNFFGTVRTVRSCLPALRASRGRIVVVGSLAGRIGMPFQAFYSSSKFALEGFVESLRYELRPFGVQVCIVEPGDFSTGFTGSRRKAAMDSPLYGEMATKVMGKQEHDEQNGWKPEALAEALLRLLGRTRLPLRMSVGGSVQRFGAWLKRLVPGTLFEEFFIAYYGMR